MSELIETLETREGKNPGEAVASYGKSIVFLSSGPKPGQRVRVRLEEITTKKDSRGRSMYRGLPALVEYIERWKDLGSGTIGRVTIAVDWLFNESEEGVRDERPTAMREISYDTRTERKVVWGQNLTDTHVAQVEVNIFRTQQEVVRDGSLNWEKVTEREERGNASRLDVTKIQSAYFGQLGPEFWETRKLEVSYQGNWTIFLDVYFGTGSGDFVRERISWDDVPAWVQNQVLVPFPVCQCGRSRVDNRNSDGYGKCELCRAEEICVRCGKQTKVVNLNGRLVCDACKSYEVQEQLVARCVPIEKRKDLAKLAEILLTAEALPEEAAMVILGATLGHVESDWSRKSWLEEWKGYAFYYFTDRGVFGTKFPAAALQVLQFLPYAVGNQLVELVAWLSGYLKVGDCERYGDFYTNTQVKGEDWKPGLTESILSRLVLATRVRGSEADRVAVVDWIEAHRESRGYETVAKAVFEILQSEGQDYSMAMIRILEIETQLTERSARIEAGEVWPDVVIPISTESRTHTDVMAILPNGSILEPKTRGTGFKNRVDSYEYGDLPTNVLVLSHSHDNYGYRLSESWEVHYLPNILTPDQEVAAHRFAEETYANFKGPNTGFNLRKVGRIVFTTQYSRDLRGEERTAYDLMCSDLPIIVSEWKVVRGERESGISYEVYARRKNPVVTTDENEGPMADAFKKALQRKG